MTQGEVGTAAQGKEGYKAGMKSHLVKTGLVFPLKTGNRKHSFKKARKRKRKNWENFFWLSNFQKFLCDSKTLNTLKS